MNTSLRLMQLFACAALAASSAYSAAAVNRCVGPDGVVLFTDQECPVSSRSASSDDGSVGIAINTGGVTARSDDGVEHVSPGIVRASLPRSVWADLPRPLQRKTIGLDAGTLQAARVTMQMQDEMRRQRHVASLR
ncbi:DUF4124 domain-containing protein [Duganella sp. Dugasp56]|uniref:DUF4124 domain-containing protein n=1 Tax=Duganella sp. Dugasp56 TaxID=3243046 RepID=UPI0039AF2B68